MFTIYPKMKFFISAIEVAVLSTILLYIDYIIMEGKEKYYLIFDYIDVFPVIGLNTLFFAFLFILYKCVKIQKILGYITYNESIIILDCKRDKRGIKKIYGDDEKEGMKIKMDLLSDDKRKHVYKYIAYLAWIMNKNTWIALQSLVGATALVCVVILINSSLYFMPVILGLLFWALLKGIHGIMDVL